MTFGQNDPDSNIFQYCMPSGQADTATPGAPAPTTKRQRPDPQAKFRGGRRHPFGPSSQQALLPSAPIQDPTLRLTSKLLLRHEEALAMQRKEKNFALFFPRCLLVSMPEPQAEAAEILGFGGVTIRGLRPLGSLTRL